MGGEVEIYASALRSCKDLSAGERIAGEICSSSSRHQHCLYLRNLAIEMFARCGSLDLSQRMFESLGSPNLHSWNIILSAYARNDHLAEAEGLFHRMPSRDAVSWTIMLKAYAAQGQLRIAEELFERMPLRDQIAWNVLLGALCDHGFLTDAVKLFGRMPQRDSFSWNTILTAYARKGQLLLAKKTFDLMPLKTVVSWNIIISAYAQSGDLDAAVACFKMMPKPNVVSWTILIAAFVGNGDLQQVESLFPKIPKPNVITWTVMLCGYVRCGCLTKAKFCFDSMPSKNVVSWTVMVAAYAREGHLQEARNLFDRMPVKSVVSWTIMITAYARLGSGREAIRLFKLMDLEGVRVDRAAFVAPLRAGDLGLGKLVAASVEIPGVEKWLVSLYGKCGSLEDAQASFEKLVEPDVATWNSLIAAYAHNGRVREALGLYEEMILEGVSPDGLTFVSVLCSCSRGGKVEKGRECFGSITSDFGAPQLLDHYQVMVDLLGRSGWLDFAEELVESMPFVPDSVTRTTLLAACKVHSDVERGMQVAERAFGADPENPVPYVILSSIYSEMCFKGSTKSELSI